MVQHEALRAFIYCRVSTREQGTDDYYSLDNQEQRCRDYLKMKRWQIAKMRKDVASGKDDSRDGFQQLLESIAAKSIDVVLVYRLDRLSRNVRDIYDFLDRIKQSGIAFVSVTEGFDTTTAMGRAMLGVAAVFAQLTREMISENTKDGILRRAESGRYCGNPTITYGYDYSKDEGLLRINAEEADVVRQIFTWYAEHKWGVDKIARTLNLRQVPSKLGNEWCSSVISTMLRNPVYAGNVRAGSTVIEGRHEPIISQELFQLALSLNESRRVLPSRTQQSQHLLSGIALCGLCGRRLRAHHDQAGRRDESGARKTYMAYGHGATVSVRKNGCKGLWKNAPSLESAVVAEIAKAASSRSIEQIVLADIKHRQQSASVPRIEERDKILLELSEIGDKFTQWADRLDAGKIDEDQFETQNRRLLERKKTLQSRLDAIVGELMEDETIEVSLAEVKKALSNFPQVWDQLEFEERRELLRLLVEYLHVYKTHAELKLLFHEPLTIPLVFKRGCQALGTSRDQSDPATPTPTSL